MKVIETVLLAALTKHRNASAAAREVGVSAHQAWRMAKKHNIELISLAEHMKQRRNTREFLAKFEATADKRRQVLAEQRAKPINRRKAAAGARAHMLALNADPEVRKASAERMKRHYDNPLFRKKQSGAAADTMRKLWSDPEFRKRMAATKSKEAERARTVRQIVKVRNAGTADEKMD